MKKYLIPILLVLNFFALTAVGTLFLGDLNGKRPTETWSVPPGEPPLVKLVPEEKPADTSPTKETVFPAVDVEAKKKTEKTVSDASSQTAPETSRERTVKAVPVSENVPLSEPNPSKPLAPPSESPKSNSDQKGARGDSPQVVSEIVSGLRKDFPAAEFPCLAMEIEVFPASEAIRSQLEPATFKKRLPTHFRAVGVTDDQAARIYRIQEAYSLSIVPLQKRIDRLATERDDAIHAVLTDEQRAELTVIKQTKKKKN